MPNVQMAIKRVNSLGFTAFFSIIKDGKLNVVTAIIKDKIVILRRICKRNERNYPRSIA